jgi:anti-anti-sigma factor
MVRREGPYASGVGDLETSSAQVDGTTVVVVTGNVDLLASDHLRRALATAVRRSADVTVDSPGVTFIDSSGLSALLDAHRRAHDAGRAMTLRHPTAMLRRLLEVTRLDTLLVLEPAESMTGDGA